MLIDALLKLRKHLAGLSMHRRERRPIAHKIRYRQIKRDNLIMGSLETHHRGLVSWFLFLHGSHPLLFYRWTTSYEDLQRLAERLSLFTSLVAGLRGRFTGTSADLSCAGRW